MPYPLKTKALAVANALAGAYPDAGCELDFRSPLECLIATMLSAQSTDKAVNTVTPALFDKFPAVEAFAAAAPETVEPFIQKLGLFRNKAKNIVAACRMIRDNYRGKVPDRMDLLLTLPGVGRKTANCVLLNAYGQPGLMVDTHFIRTTTRLGLHALKDPDKIEFAIGKLLPPAYWGDLSHRLIIHGRRVCHARKPDCGGCPLAGLCAFVKNSGIGKSPAGGNQGAKSFST